MYTHTQIKNFIWFSYLIDDLSLSHISVEKCIEFKLHINSNEFSTFGFRIFQHYQSMQFSYWNFGWQSNHAIFVYIMLNNHKNIPEIARKLTIALTSFVLELPYGWKRNKTKQNTGIGIIIHMCVCVFVCGLVVKNCR